LVRPPPRHASPTAPLAAPWRVIWKEEAESGGAAMQVWAVSLNGYDDTTTSLAEAVANGTAV